jgi:predicted ATP-grasp superfamily ATP-dependent carboligase
LNINKLLDILNEYSSEEFAGVVTGSGLETHADILEYINRNWSLYGNDAKTVRSCKDPALFFNLLDSLGIPHPEIVMGNSDIEGEWLLKHSGGSGGDHISRYMKGDVMPCGSYLQKKIEGRSLSVVFLADGKTGQVIGINEIWPVAPDKNDYRYLGAVTLPEFGTPLAGELEEITHTLVETLELRGLCGMDLIIDEYDQCHILEINPRPTATFELHERTNSLFKAHIQACKGRLEFLTDPGKTYFAHKVIYATEDFIVPEFVWPFWTTDRPASGKVIRKDNPVCMIQVHADDIPGIHLLLETRTQALQQLLTMQKWAA